MTSTSQPAVFLSHGAGPSFYLDAKIIPRLKGLDKDSKAANFLRNFVDMTKLTHPDAILVLSAHWEESECTVQIQDNPTLYYDYGGFPPEMYKLSWPVKGAPQIARKVKDLLTAKGIPCRVSNDRGLDHGVFVPLKLAYPKADIPVFQVSLLRNLDMKKHLDIAEALAPIRQENILIIGSGFATHAAGSFEKPPAEWALQFQEWLHDILGNPSYSPEERKAKLQSYKSVPSFSNAHPRIEHYLPLAMACAASGYKQGKLLFSEFLCGSLLNEHYIFKSD